MYVRVCVCVCAHPSVLRLYPMKYDGEAFKAVNMKIYLDFHEFSDWKVVDQGVYKYYHR